MRKRHCRAPSRGTESNSRKELQRAAADEDLQCFARRRFCPEALQVGRDVVEGVPLTKPFRSRQSRRSSETR
eukprot:2562997-Alexandrium_andersonii.AAC.1